MKRSLWIVLACAVCAVPLPAPEVTIDDFFRTFTDDWVRHDPNLATSARYFTGEEQDRLERQLRPETQAWKRDRIRRARRGLAELRKFDHARMTETQRVSADLMQWQLDTVVREEPFLDFTFPLEQFNGVNVGLIETLTVRHPLLSEKDAANYLAVLAQVSARMEEAIAEAQRIAIKNMFPPRFIIDATLTQLKQFIAPPPAQNPFVTVFDQKMSAVKAISDARRAEMRAEAERIVAAQVYPAWRKAIALLDPLRDRATDDAGIRRFKGGAEDYAYALRRYTTTNLTAEQIHQIGLQQVDQIETEMDAIFRRLGRTQGTLKERIAKLSQDLAYPRTEDGRKMIMADVEQILRDAQKRSESLFDRVPKAPVKAQPFPRFREASAAANYNSPAPDGSRPGIFQIPLRPERVTKYGLRSLVYHETVPGHHFQIALQVENKDLPRFRQIGAFGGISALVEGWGLYAERLAAESDWYKDDPEGLLGQLDSELFRARRLVVDTGIHSKHWTRQQAIDYGIEASEVERYAIWPGQACSYMIGELKILELRDKARKALGDKFSFYQFHDVVLGTGTVPLEILERQVDAYIRAAGG